MEKLKPILTMDDPRYELRQDLFVELRRKNANNADKCNNDT